MTHHRYPLRSLLLDAVRAGFGLMVTIGPLLALDVALPLAIAFGALGVVFFAFALRVVAQAVSPIELSDQGVSRHGPFARHLPWSDVTAVKLARYAVQRRSVEGWYQLTLMGGRRVIKIDSTIERFEMIVAAAVEAARTNGVGFDLTTSDNLKELGHAAG